MSSSKVSGISFAYSAGMSFKTLLIISAVIAALACHSENPTQNPVTGEYFTVQVGSATFVMFATDLATIQFAKDNYFGKNHRFPSGPISTGHGGFNHPWNWHFVPDTVRMVEASIEVCDGTPAYVNDHLSDYLAVGYCPWSAKVIKIGR